VSELFTELLKLVDPDTTVVSYVSPNFGITPAEVSDIFPVSQVTEVLEDYGEKDFILNSRKWARIDVMIKHGDPASKWLADQLRGYSKKNKQKILVSTTYKSFKKKLTQV
jgi:hypothetical protein